MDNVTNVTPEIKVTPVPVMYTQSRKTKLGMSVVTIQQVGDLFESIVTITHNKVVFRAEGIFSSVREAFHWSYGVKQEINDGWSGYQDKDGILIETKPRKNMTARTSTIADALKLSISDYDNFELSKSSGSGDKVSMSSVRSSTLLSDEDKATMDRLFAKMGKVTV